VDEGTPGTTNEQEKKSRGFLASILIAIGRQLVKLLIAFAIGTVAGAIFCWYYDIPLIFSLAGGILVVGIALAASSDSIFD
jgi:hypothetical protein